MTRRIRHWRQRLEPGVRLVWSRRVVWDGVDTVPGEPIPAELETDKRKLRRFWESRHIELADFGTGAAGEGGLTGGEEIADTPTERDGAGATDWEPTEPAAEPTESTGEPLIEDGTVWQGDDGLWRVTGRKGRLKSRDKAIAAAVSMIEGSADEHADE